MRGVAGSFLARVVFALAMVVASLASLVSVRPAQAATFTIPDGDVAALIAAINTANGNGEPDTIELAARGTYTLTAFATSGSYGASGLPAITSEITINGNGATITRSSADGTPDFRIVTVIGGGDLTLDSVMISNGRETLGGGIYVQTSVLRLTNSTISGNAASSGGVGNGGGINGNAGSTLYVTNTTISGNTADVGGGIMVWKVATIINSTISGNTAIQGGGLRGMSGTPPLLINTIVAGNTASSGGNDISGEISGTSTFNLIGDGTGMTGITDGVAGNQVGTTATPINPLLGPLADNGGPTQTMALLTGSPAIDAGTSTGQTPATDQRGVSRPKGTANDIGAYELTEPTAPVITPTITGTLGANGWYTSDVNVTWTISNPDSKILDSTGCDPTTITTDTAGQTLTCQATTAGGVSSVPVTIKRDATNPVVAYTGNLGNYDLTDTIAITCTATDALSGIATSDCANISGPATTFGPGTHTFSATATDNAGHVGTATTSFVVDVTYADLCTLTQQLVGHPIMARVACASLRLAERAAQVGNVRVEQMALNMYRMQIRIGMAFRVIPASNGQNLIDWSYAID